MSNNNLNKTNIKSYEESLDEYKKGKITKEQFVKQVKEKEEFDKKEEDRKYREYKNKQIAHGVLDIATAAIPIGGGIKVGSKLAQGAIKKLTPYLGRKIAEGTVKGGIQGAAVGGVHGVGSGIIDEKNPIEKGIKEAGIGIIAGSTLGLASGKIKLNKQIKDNNYTTKRRKDWGIAYRKASGNPKLAIDTLLKNQQGFVPKAFYKKGVGDIDLVWGDSTGGLKHIIDRRNSQNIDGIEYIKKLPEIIKRGDIVEKNHPGRKYIVDDKTETVIRLDFNNAKRKWIVSSYYQYGEVPAQASSVLRPSNEAFADRQVIPLSNLNKVPANIIPNQKTNINHTSGQKGITDGMQRASQIMNVSSLKAIENIENKDDKEKQNKIKSSSVDYDNFSINGKKYKDWTDREIKDFWEGFDKNTLGNPDKYPFDKLEKQEEKHNKNNNKSNKDNKDNKKEMMKIKTKHSSSKHSNKEHWVTINHNHILIKNKN